MGNHSPQCGALCWNQSAPEGAVAWVAGPKRGLCVTFPALVGSPCTHKGHSWEQGGQGSAPSTQHQPGAGDQRILRGTTLPPPLFAAHPAANTSSHQLPSAFSPVVPHNPHLATSILYFFLLSLSKLLGPGVLCWGAEQFTALSCKIPRANASRVNLPPHKREDTRAGAKSP